MTEQDKEHLEMLYAGFAMIGFIMSGEDPEDIPHMSKDMAKRMLEEPDGGIAVLKPKRKYTRKGDADD
jgi:hypothetical protein